MSIASRIAALLGVSTYANATPAQGMSLDDPQVVEARKVQGGQLSPLPITKTRWHDFDLEDAERSADMGILAPAAQLMRSARKDGTFAGVLSTATDGLVRLPKTFRGDPEIVAALEVGHDNVRSVFDEMFPPAELALMAADGKLLGVAVGELVPVVGRDYPVLVRQDPACLVYRWNENRWYFQSIVGLLPITPGDGRWILHTPGGRMAPWQNGLWRAIGRAWIDKEHARLHKANWEGKLANPARVAVSPQSSPDEHSEAWFRAVMAWGMNTVFGMKPGYDVKLIESNGRGYECFLATIAAANTDMIVAVAGQVVTTDGGTGFANADIHKSIRADLIKATADSLAYTINTQGIPPWVMSRWGVAALDRSVVVEWDVAPPKDRAADATALAQAANALTSLQAALGVAGRKLDVNAFALRFGITLLHEEKPVDDAAEKPPIFAYHLDAGIVKRNEMRERLGLDPVPGPEGDEFLGDADGDDSSPVQEAA